MSDEIVKSGSGWKLRISKPFIAKGMRGQVPYRTVFVTLNSQMEIGSLEEYTFHALEENFSVILGRTTWNLREIFDFHKSYQDRLSSATKHLFDHDGFVGSVSAQGIRIELRLPTWEEYLAYWRNEGQLPVSPVSGLLFGGADTVIASIQTPHEKALTLVNLLHFSHWGEYHLNLLKTGMVEEVLQEYVLAYKRKERWFSGKDSFAGKINCTSLPV